MSVCIYSESELKGLYLELVAHGANPKNVAIALISAGLANRMAFTATYQDRYECPATIEDFLSDSVEPYRPMADWPLASWVRNLLYNCVSNDGRDYCGPKTADYLETVARKLK